jgi:hypothetical protein
LAILFGNLLKDENHPQQSLDILDTQVYGICLAASDVGELGAVVCQLKDATMECELHVELESSKRTAGIPTDEGTIMTAYSARGQEWYYGFHT